MMKRSTAALFVIPSIFISMCFAGGNIELSTYCGSQTCGLVATSSLVSTLISMGLLTLWGSMSYRPVASKGEVVGTMWRFGAFFLDMLLLMLAVLPLLVVLVLGVEFLYTGEWTWTLRREMPRPTDTWLLYGGIGGMLLTIGAYFYRALRLGRPTLGRYIAGYQIAVQHGDPGLGRGRALNHLVVSWLSLIIWPITLVIGWFKGGVHLWDEATDTRALAVERDAFGGETSDSFE